MLVVDAAKVGFGALQSMTAMVSTGRYAWMTDRSKAGTGYGQWPAARGVGGPCWSSARACFGLAASLGSCSPKYKIHCR